MNPPADPRTSTDSRDALGRFGPGNPGRRVGSKNKLSRDTLHAVQNLAGEAVHALRLRIAAGDMTAIAYALDRILPRGRPVELDSADPLAVADSLASGEITSGEAKDIATALAKLRDVAEIDDLRARLDELEQAVRK
ncbi:hypothetical protein [Sphingomonas sp. MA1305]|uniref:hypothetical protein n=1 Tax=Sphingomonas sp. MA1305 TaxID=2479204 RepID=UPI0018DFFF6C|nr:hypothetical protein [Sphingomonas sp. MA1305]